MKRRKKRHSPLLCCQAHGRILRVLFCLTSGPNANEHCKAAKITEILNQNSCGLSRGLFEPFRARRDRVALFKRKEAGHGQTQTHTLAATQQKLRDASLMRTRRRFSVERCKKRNQRIFRSCQALAGMHVIGTSLLQKGRPRNKKIQKELSFSDVTLWGFSSSGVHLTGSCKPLAKVCFHHQESRWHCGNKPWTYGKNWIGLPLESPRTAAKTLKNILKTEMLEGTPEMWSIIKFYVHFL